MASSSLPTDRDRPGRPAEEVSIPTADNGYAYGSFPSYDNATDAALNPADPNSDAFPSAYNYHDANGHGGAPKPPTTTRAGSNSSSSNTRALAPDLLRGLLMMLMAMDHLGLALNAWPHGTGRVMEGDGAVVSAWNRRFAYAVRTLTHLCAPGFTFLLGMGVVYLARSRARLGWSEARLARYLGVRCLALLAVNEAWGLAMTGGKVWVFNIVLVALAVDYLLAGLLWLALARSERALARGLDAALRFYSKRFLGDGEDDDDDSNARRSLLARAAERGLVQSGARSRIGKASSYAEDLSWHMHNVLLLILSLVTIFWNIWLSPDNGHCRQDSSAAPEQPQPEDLSVGQILTRFWFWPVMTQRVLNGFPPLAWVSFAVFGLLYARILVARRWTAQDLAFGHAMAGIVMAILFVLTRVLPFGNLSEDCLRAPEHERLGAGGNPYFASPQSFFYIVKYPPDVAFWAFTLAGNFFLLALFVALPARVARRLTVLLDFGTSALFFYVLHIVVAFMLGYAMVALFGYDTGREDPNTHSSQGIDNPLAFLGIWALLILIMWPLSRWYSRFKSTKPADSLWRLF